MLGYCLSSIVSLGMQEPWRGESVVTSSTELLPSCSFARAIRGRRLIPDDYSSPITIPKLNCRFPKRTVTMQETYADRCREGYS